MQILLALAYDWEFFYLIFLEKKKLLSLFCILVLLFDAEIFFINSEALIKISVNFYNNFLFNHFC